MSLNIGIVGLPNVGKSTVFNALTGAQNAAVANYPFCTIQPNRAVVPIPDPRLEKLAHMVGVGTIIHATIEFVDIAGLVKGASQGEGLGNQFLGQIRNTDAILQVVRCFDDPNVIHVSETIDALDDIEVINLELALADMQQLERRIDKLQSQAKADKHVRPLLDSVMLLHDHLASGEPISTFPAIHQEPLASLVNEMRFLTAKPMIYAANVDEAGLSEPPDCARIVLDYARAENARSVVLCARLEEEMQVMTSEERQEFLQLAGAESSGLEQVIREGFSALNLISFFTKNENEVRAWMIPRGTLAPQAAGAIHTDFERGFIRAEVIPFEMFQHYGSDAAARAAGQIRLEGKEYPVADGDVIYFRFNV